jgi:DNA gyrase/topoisomerase IV subunit A
MPDDPATTPVRTLTEHEAYAIAADRVQRDTAALTEQVEELTKEKAELSSKLDVSEAQLATERAAKEKAEKDLGDYKSQVDQERQVASRRDARVAKIREVAKHLNDDFYTDERVTRWAQMDDEAFGAYTAEMAAVSTGPVSSTPAPRETAMTGAVVVASSTGDTNYGEKLFALRRGGAA